MAAGTGFRIPLSPQIRERVFLVRTQPYLGGSTRIQDTNVVGDSQRSPSSAVSGKSWTFTTRRHQAIEHT